MSMMSLNVWAWIVATAVYFVIGWLWYSPWVLGKQWMESLGKKQADFKASPVEMVIGIISSLVTAYILNNVVNFAGATDWLAGVMVGFFSWLGFVAAVMINNVLYEKKSWANYLINIGYYLVGFAAMGAILAVWK